MKQAITLALIACTFVNGAVLQNKMADKKALSQSSGSGSSGLGQGVITSFASGVQAEIDQTN